MYDIKMSPSLVYRLLRVPERRILSPDGRTVLNPHVPEAPRPVPGVGAVEAVERRVAELLGGEVESGVVQRGGYSEAQMAELQQRVRLACSGAWDRGVSSSALAHPRSRMERVASEDAC